MQATTLMYASLGGLIAFAATGAGVLLSRFTSSSNKIVNFKFSIEFALGLMLAAVAFSMVLPVTSQYREQPVVLLQSWIFFLLGAGAIYLLKIFIEHRQGETNLSHSAQKLLALALIVHNFPEGLASGASLAGLKLEASIPILSSLAIQNIPEGFLFVYCLLAMGYSRKMALVGGVLSGVVELLGGVVSGFAMSWSAQTLPLLLMSAGGAMLLSVWLELRSHNHSFRLLRNPQFAMGLLSIPILNGLTSILIGS